VGLAILVVVWSGPARGSAERVPSTCSRAQVSAYSYSAGGATGHAAELIVLIDRGRPCVLRGYLRVRLLDRGHDPIRTLTERTVAGWSYRLPIRTVRLETGSKASFKLDYGDEPSVLGPGVPSCEVVSWLGVQLVGGRLDVPTRFAPCGGGFDESPVQPGVLAPERRG
jgi:hypothetical protein